MLVKEIPFKDYTYKRVKFITSTVTQYYPENTENFIIKNYGDEELHPEHGIEVVGDWLVIMLNFTPTEDQISKIG